MNIVKKKYLTLSIHNQIQIGIISVSLSMAFLVIIFLFFCSFILLNMIYLDYRKLLENTEDKSLDKVLEFNDLNFNALKDFSKDGIQYIRNMYENVKRRDDIFNISFIKKNYSRYLKPYGIGDIDCNSNTIDSIYNCISYDNSIISDNLNELLNHLFFTFPFFRKAMDQRYLKINNNSLYDNIIIYRNNSNSVISYPFSNLSINLTKEDINNKIVYFSNEVSKTYNKINDLNNTFNQGKNMLLNYSDIYQLFHNCPILNFPISNFSDYKPIDNFLTFSFAFNKNVTNLTMNDKNTFENVIVAKSSIDLINTIMSNNYMILNGTTSILTFYDQNQTIITNFTCQRLKKIQNSTEFLNNNTLYNISDCILDDTYKEQFTQDFLNDTTFGSIKRKWKRTIVKYQYSDIPFKIFRSFSPDLYVKNLTSSNYFYSFYSILYVFKNPEVMIKNSDFIYYQIIMILFQICYVVFTVWNVIILIITFLLYTVTINLSTPIKKLIELIVYMGNDDTEKINMELEKINYPDDNEIDDFFKLCKNLVKGGFKKEIVNQVNMKFLSLAQFNISFVKINNIIIDETLLNKVYSNDFLIFNYPSQKELEEKAKTHVMIELQKNFMSTPPIINNILNNKPVDSISNNKQTSVYIGERFKNCYTSINVDLNDNITKINEIAVTESIKQYDSPNDDFKIFEFSNKLKNTEYPQENKINYLENEIRFLIHDFDKKIKTKKFLKEEFEKKNFF